MNIELIVLITSITIIILIYFGRFYARSKPSVFFTSSFLIRMDDAIFHFIMFVYKMYVLVIGNIVHFFREVPHKVADLIHKMSHTVATKSHSWPEKLKPKHHDKKK